MMQTRMKYRAIRSVFEAHLVVLGVGEGLHVFADLFYNGMRATVMAS